MPLVFRFLMLTLSVYSIFSFSGCKHSDSKLPLDIREANLNPADDFTLTDQNGQPFHLKDHRGETIFLFFGYVSCPDVCPTTLSKLSRVNALLEQKNIKTLTLFVTIDPERDTTAKLKEYLEYFKINMVGLTGTKAEIDAVIDAYKGMYERVETNSAMGYLFNHSDFIYLIDPQGKVRFIFHPDDSAEEVADVILKL